MDNCPEQNKKECIMARFRNSLNARPAASYDARQPRKSQACEGLERLNKISFLASIGSKRYIGPDFKVVSLAEQKLNELIEILEENGMDWNKSAASLGISPSVLRKRYNSLLSVVESSTISNEERASPTPERRYFEKLSTPWSITSFDPASREVCIEIEGDSIIAHISSRLPLP